MKPSVYRRAVLVVISLGILMLPMGCHTLSVSFETTSLDNSAASAESSQSQNDELASASPSSNQEESGSTEVKNTAILNRGNSDGASAPQSNLRMSNQTNQPVRLALLSRGSFGSSASAMKNLDAVPAHWDFAPQEGGETGLVLSLPDRKLKLEKGDILVAFAQDGSRRYWGPYVVGETSAPVWNPQQKEWKLVLNP